MNRWRQVADTLSADLFPIRPMSQHMYLAAAEGKLGEETKRINEWQRALECAEGKPELLLELGSYASVRAPSILLAERLMLQLPRPRRTASRSTEHAVSRKLEAEQKARKEIVSQMLLLWPEDRSLHVDTISTTLDR